jgi:hypothetical protein
MNQWYQETFLGTIREYQKLYGTERSSHWRKVRNAYIKQHPLCAVCGKKKGNHVHHIVPFHVDPRLELRFSNLITLCSEHHFFIGHLNFWASWNESVKEDALAWSQKIKNRPSKNK